MFTVIKWRFITALISSITLLLLFAFEWSIVDRLTGFLYSPLMGLAWLGFAGVGIASLTCMAKYRTIGLRTIVPSIVMAITVVIAMYFPFTDVWLECNYLLKAKERNMIVAKVNSGELKPNVSHNAELIALGGGYPYVSAGGNEIMVESHYCGKHVFFFTYRGILDSYSGFLYVPEGGSPSSFSDLDERDSTQITPKGGNWYFTSHH